MLIPPLLVSVCPEISHVSNASTECVVSFIRHLTQTVRLSSSNETGTNEHAKLALMQTVAFGMGGGLLQRVNRDTMSFATKLSHIVYADGSQTDIMKLPKSDPSKYSLPGVMAVKSVHGIPTAYPADGGHVTSEENMLQVIWNKGPVQVNQLASRTGTIRVCAMRLHKKSLLHYPVQVCFTQTWGSTVILLGRLSLAFALFCALASPNRGLR